MKTTTFDSQMGLFKISLEDGKVLELCHREDWLGKAPKKDILTSEEQKLVEQVKKQIEQYHTGKRKNFDFPVSLHGTEFQKKVWRALTEISFGKTKTYGEIAILIGSPGAARAVGTAVKKNPLLIAVPCHRVVASQGIGGFNAGVDLKKRLLQIEGVFFS
ncbi:MAG: methylated-DNA--[protein]-cysteine S-methyltransferase [Pseudobdellovibrionaceae bacterium]